MLVSSVLVEGSSPMYDFPMLLMAWLVKRILELNELIKCLDRTVNALGMEINAEKTKVVTNNAEGIRGDIRINVKRLETVNQFKYFPAIVTDEGSESEMLSRIAQATHVISQLKVIWKDKNKFLRMKIRLMRTLLLSIFLYARKTWTLTHDLQKRIQYI